MFSVFSKPLLPLAALLLVAPRLLAQAPSGVPASWPQQPVPAGLPGLKKSMALIKPIAVFPVEGAPDWSVITPDATWVSSRRNNHLVQLRATDNQVGLIVEVNQPCSGLTAGFGSIWTPNCKDKLLQRIDPATGKITASIPAAPENSEGGITTGDGAVWLVVKGNAIPTTSHTSTTSVEPSLIKVDPQTNTIVGKVTLPLTAADPVFADGFVWVSTFNSNSVVKVDPHSMKVLKTIPLGEGTKPRFLTSGAGFVWVLNQGTGTVVKIDTKTSAVVATIPTGLTGQGGDISYSDGYVWATLSVIPLTKIDAHTDKVIAQWAGPGGDGMRVGGGSIWLSNGDEHSVWRISTHIE